MFRLLFVTILAVGALSAQPAVNMKTSNLDLSANIYTVKDLDEARLLFPTAQFTKMEMNANTKGVIRYTLGNRLNGDRLVAQGSDGKTWSQPQNIQLLVEYPQSGTGAVVTYVEVVVDQSTNLGQGYVVSGGIGQRKIGVLIEGKNTLWFHWAAAIYGL